MTIFAHSRKGARVKVLVVDDSASVRETLREIITADPELELQGAVSDPYGAARLIAIEVPDVIVLDVEMPRMDGITFLRKLMQQRPVPVVMCSSLTDDGSDTLMEALEAGAVDVICKPRLGSREFLLETQTRILDAIKAAAQARLRRRGRPPSADASRPLVTAKLTADAVLPPPVVRSRAAMIRTSEKIVCIGASTGGTESLRALFEGYPADAPGTVVVQHMPEAFTAAFARRLDTLCTVQIAEACNNDTILRGRVLIAPGNRHVLVRRSGARYYVEVRDGPLVCRHRPSVDVLFRSAAQYAGANAVGVLMTGMGDDGARGLLEMREAGAYTIAEAESSCVVFGMPKEAIRLGAARAVVALERLGQEILRGCTAAPEAVPR